MSKPSSASPRSASRALRPVGEYLPLGSGSEGTPDWTCGGRYTVRHFGSGTAALSAALRFAANRNARQEGFALMPGYGCPDLVAAASAAHLRPRLVDLAPDLPWLDIREVERQLPGATALVAVNFLGMRERLEPLIELCRSSAVPIIEDSAQMAPFAGGSQPSGDFVVTSFGRGKPLALLGGGALLVRADWSQEFDRLIGALPLSSGSMRYFLKRLLYNAAIHPRVYAHLRRLPMLKLGEVAYHPLERNEPMSAAALAQLAIIDARSKITAAPQNAIATSLAAQRCSAIDLAAANGAADSPLLRYPLLLQSAEQRDRCFSRLDDAGLGASRMYVSALCDIAGVPGVAGQWVPRAASFAARLLTLPVHSDVTSEDVNTMTMMIAST